MISPEKANQIEAKLAALIAEPADAVRDYLHGYVRAGDARRTGWRFVRGSHSGSYVRDRDGTDILPAGYLVGAP